MLNSCVSPASTNAQETMVLTKTQQEKIKVSENNLVRRIMGVKTADKRSIDELRVEFGVKERFKKKLARIRLK